MRAKEATLEKLRRPARVKKLNHKFDETDEILAIEMRGDHYNNYNSPRCEWTSMRFDYKLSWIIRAQKLRCQLSNFGISITPKVDGT